MRVQEADLIDMVGSRSYSNVADHREDWRGKLVLQLRVKCCHRGFRLKATSNGSREEVLGRKKGWSRMSCVEVASCVRHMVQINEKDVFIPLAPSEKRFEHFDNNIQISLTRK